MYRFLRFTSIAARIFIGLAGLGITFLGLPAVAQDSPRASLSLAATRSSPFDPPTKDVFVADSGPGLDTGCTFNTDPNHPLRIDVMVDQAVGPVDSNGFLVNPGALIAQGVIPATVEVTLPAFDVDVNGAPPPEKDDVLLNGELLGSLTGDDSIWKLNSFSVPVSKIKFPAPVPSGSPSPVANRVQINIDTLSSGRWCTSIDWVALAIPIKLKAAFKLVPTIGNKISVRDYASAATIDTIYDQSFDADCNVTTDIGNPSTEYPFSGPAIPGNARLHATIKRCPANDHLTPEVKVEWKVAGTSLTGVSTWSGNQGDIDLTMPNAVGAYDVELKFTIDEKSYPAVNRKLFVTRTTPTLTAPRLGWYEKATDWATGQTDEASILTALLAGEYAFGQANWRYGYFGTGTSVCNWQSLVRDPISCNFADCFIFSDVLQNMAATLGISGLSAVKPEGTHPGRGFLTSGAPSLDDAFPGSAKRLGTSTYDRYLFTSHSLRLKGSTYYDATFNGRYSSSTSFISANLSTGFTNSDASGVYAKTDEGWNVYGLSGSIYDSWGNFAYKPPTPFAPSAAPVLQGPLPQPVSTADIEFTGNATYNLLDEDLNGLAEGLTAEVEVRLNTSGEYRILGVLQKGEQPIAYQPSWESMIPVEATLDRIAGTYKVTLRFSGEQIYRSSIDGPYDLVLVGIGASGFATATLTTQGYDNAQFGELPGRFTGASEAAIDTTGDGKFEFLDVTLDLDVRLPGELQLQGALEKDGQTLADAGATENLTAGSRQVTLHFDGRKIRRSGLDGPYEGSVNLIDATGHTIDSFRFTTRPYTSGSFSAPIVPQGPFTDQGVDTNGNGLYDLLRISFGALIEQAGTYRLTGVLRGADSSAVVYADSLLTVPAGSTTVRLEFAGPLINSLALDGPYTVDVLVRDPATLQDLDVVRLPFTTASYRASQFDRFGSSNQPIVLTGNSSDFGVDTNGNGLFDELHVNVEVALARTDFYEWSARLVDRNGKELGFYTRRATLSAGVTNINFVFDGEAIGKNGVDGPYFVKSLLIFGRSGANLVTIDVAETQPYRVTKFEGAGDSIPPQITVSSQPTVLWPANHQQQVFEVADFVLAATDNQDPTVSVDDVVITKVTSDEPVDAPGNGDGSTLDDIVIAPGCRSIQLRSERAGGGNGRVYTIHVAVADASGNVGTASYKVTVPHDSSGGSAIDDGPAYSVEGCTP